MSQKSFFNYPVKAKEHLCGCSVFVVESPEGEQIVGRNFDYAKTGALLVHTRPKNGYASYSMVCLAHLDITEENNRAPDKLMGKLLMLSAPYGCVEGLNEKGLCVVVLELKTEPTAQDNGKKDIITTVAVRMLLDKCSTTEEAIKMLDKYDMFSSAGKPYHFLITDINKNTVVVEWAEQKMVVLDSHYATNFQLADGKDYRVGAGHDRYEIIQRALEKSQFTLTEKDAMKLLEDVKVEWNGTWDTEWSIVYNVNKFSLKICRNMDFNSVYEF